MKRTDAPIRDRWELLLLGAVFLVGVVLRFWDPGGPGGVGFDEKLYRIYTKLLVEKGVFGYSEILQSYIAKQEQTPTPLLPPTRVAFLLCTGGVAAVSGCDPVVAVRAVSALAAAAVLAIAAAFALRAAGSRFALGVTAMLAVAPLQLHIAHRAWVDGFFGMWAILAAWALWEALRDCTSRAWPVVYGAALAAAVMTKENAIFIYPSMIALLAANHWINVGPLRREIVIATLAGPAAGVVGLILFSGGADHLLHALMLNRTASYHPSAYGAFTGDGPWHRYLAELFIVSPLAMLLAVGGLFGLKKEDRAAIWMAVFLAATYAAMCWVRYGLNLRYGNIWDLPIRWLAMATILRLAAGLPQRWRVLAPALCVLAVVAQDIGMYWRLFEVGGIYDPIPAELLRELDVLK